MKEFNHLKNLCEFLYAGSEQINSIFDDEFPFDENEARRLFSEHAFNLMVEDGAGVDEEMARRLAYIFESAFYRTPQQH